MGMSPKLVLRQSQQLAITPQLMQAIKLLQLSSLELDSFVERELVQNPLLERDERGEGILADTDGPPEPHQALADERPDWTSDQLETSAQAVADHFDTAPENVFPEDVRQAWRAGLHVMARQRVAGGLTRGTTLTVSAMVSRRLASISTASWGFACMILPRG
jgi:DNA-directed RNA polymerase specialized sigma54-like protein